jgi:hypothetical protein
MCPATVSEVAYFNLYIFVDKRTPVVLFHLNSLIRSSSLLSLVFIMLSLDTLLNLVFLDEILLDFGTEVAIIEELILVSFLVISQIRKGIAPRPFNIIMKVSS